MKIILFFSLLAFHISTPSTAQNIDSLLIELHKAINDAKTYDNNKLKEIGRLKSLLNQSSNHNLNTQFEIQSKLYEEYKYYN